MNKYLEALKEARKFRHEKEEHLVLIDIDYYNCCLDGIEKELKAFEIIKKKGVAVGFIQMLQKDNLGGVNEYNDYVGDPKLHLTPEEYDLLKEVLTDER